MATAEVSPLLPTPSLARMLDMRTGRLFGDEQRLCDLAVRPAAAGVIRMKVRLFLAAVIVGRVAKNLLLAYAGDGRLHLIMAWSGVPG
jgi:hypothetical protein